MPQTMQPLLSPHSTQPTAAGLLLAFDNGAAMVQWDHALFVGPVVLKLTGSNPGHSPRLGRASTQGNGSQMELDVN
ncbi:hypothetical protein E2C01_064978 [Portunus trituberculatus]|uniref:Uncharacterized protein n=1 Tax=Portunus trituberculatus TaxID=210409 RepID=A0A5B7HKN1_PORTR|nr:hypothetical protein [Portunus trituberculatus]